MIRPPVLFYNYIPVSQQMLQTSASGVKKKKNLLPQGEWTNSQATEHVLYTLGMLLVFLLCAGFPSGEALFRGGLSLQTRQ